MMLAGTLTVVFGILLMDKLSGGFQSGWFKTEYGQMMSIGGGLAIIAYLLGFIINMPTAMKMGKLGKAIAAAGGQPTPEQAAQLHKLRSTLGTVTQIIAFLLFLTVIAMAGGKYFATLMA
jgi:hypothetical protein